jgi:hypothetical protein
VIVTIKDGMAGLVGDVKGPASYCKPNLVSSTLNFNSKNSIIKQIKKISEKLDCKIEKIEFKNEKIVSIIRKQNSKLKISILTQDFKSGNLVCAISSN